MTAQDDAMARVWLREQGADHLVEVPSSDPRDRTIFSYVEERIAASAERPDAPDTGALIQLGHEVRALNLELEDPRVHQVIGAWPDVPAFVPAFVVVPDVPGSTMWGWSRDSGWTELRRAAE